ncbi:serine protease persephone [Anoplophora glabripennis]|uniref:serine protease persephone n=1 Tax=Anoplophora glabripennis TaxID=217634 RepID=UPI000874073C|nr:serine protease persephone [Anoplophora glabripennis]
MFLIEMQVALVYILCFIGLAKADIDWNTVFPNHLLNISHSRAPHGIPSPRITGGVEAVPNSIPYQVALFIPVSVGTGFCGGSLIAPQTVLTAAHCVDEAVGPVLVILGAHRVRDLEPTQVRVSTSSIYIHPKWSRLLLRNDIALIRLPSPVVLNNAIQIVSLAGDTSNSFEGHEARVSGWGLESDESTAISEVLRQVNIPVISNTVCNVAYLGVIQETHICASGLGGKSTCSGDSGGPLVIGGVQVGIVSFGLGLGCEIGWPPVFTRVTSFIEWIRGNITLAGVKMKAFNVPGITFVIISVSLSLWGDVLGKHISKSEKAESKERNGRRANGDEAKPHSLPYMAAIHTITSDKAVLCGGTLISDSIVMTAARCVSGTTEAEVILGAHNIDEEEDTQVVINSSEFVIHPNYTDDSNLHDIALIQLPTSVTLNENIALVALPTLDDANYDDALGFVAGWGKTTDTTYSSVLQVINVTIIPTTACEVSLAFDQICTKRVEEKSICLGDSGSPLVVDRVQVGIVSYGSNLGCAVGLPGVYTRIARYLSWLYKNIEG